MPEVRRLTPSEMQAILRDVREDAQAAAEEARRLGKQLDEANRAKARQAAERLPAPPKLPKLTTTAG